MKGSSCFFQLLNMFKIDLHTHSTASPDGDITEKEYREIIAKKTLDYIAITDHNRIDYAKRLQKGVGSAIIVGEEITTDSGEIIGLFLTAQVAAYQTIEKTIQAIHYQGGLVYVPHPFDRLRHGIGEKNLLEYIDDIDIIEGFNGRVILKSANTQAIAFAKKYNKVIGVGSDAHSRLGLGHAYSMVPKAFTRDSALTLLKNAEERKKYQPWSAYLAPKWNRIKKTCIMNNE